MICFRDKTFCADIDCVKFEVCPKAFTEKEKIASIEWWGSKDAPISFYRYRLDCYVAREEEEGESKCK